MRGGRRRLGAETSARVLADCLVALAGRAAPKPYHPWSGRPQPPLGRFTLRMETRRAGHTSLPVHYVSRRPAPGPTPARYSSRPITPGKSAHAGPFTRQHIPALRTAGRGDGTALDPRLVRADVARRCRTGARLYARQAEAALTLQRGLRAGSRLSARGTPTRGAGSSFMSFVDTGGFPGSRRLGVRLGEGSRSYRDKTETMHVRPS